MLKKKTAPTFSSLFLGPLTAALIVDLNSPFITESCHLWLESPSKTGTANFQKCRAVFSLLPRVALAAPRHPTCSKTNSPPSSPSPISPFWKWNHNKGLVCCFFFLLLLLPFLLSLSPHFLSLSNARKLPAWRMKFLVHPMAGLVAVKIAVIQI